uniref:T-cell immunomodulatory n=1 Tax=Lygus hesperus TaxID=30085 RepID=A0A0A9YHG2_LYGHE
MLIDFVYPVQNNLVVWVYDGVTYQCNNIDNYLTPSTALVHGKSPYTPTSVYSVDLNSDCRKDLVLVKKYDSTDNNAYLEMWIENYGNFTNHSMGFDLRQGFTKLVFGDWNTDGAVDMIIPYCHPSDTCASTNEFVIYYNIQKHVCQG